MVEEVISLKRAEAPSRFRKGQVVCLQSDKIAMTVAKISRTSVTVIWHNDVGDWDEREVDPEVLRPEPLEIEVEVELE